MEPIKSFKDLIIWQKSIELAKLVYKTTMVFSAEEKFGLTQQIRRSAVSIPSNIAEGWARQSSNYFSQFLKISRGSLAELETQMIIANAMQFIDEQKFHQTSDCINEISRLLNALIRSIEQKSKV